jgi:hypothetical protein
MASASCGGRHFGSLIGPEHTGLRLMCQHETPNGQVMAQYEEACSLNLTRICKVLLVNLAMAESLAEACSAYGLVPFHSPALHS